MVAFVFNKFPDCIGTKPENKNKKRHRLFDQKGKREIVPPSKVRVMSKQVAGVAIIIMTVELDKTSEVRVSRYRGSVEEVLNPFATGSVETS